MHTTIVRILAATGRLVSHRRYEQRVGATAALMVRSRRLGPDTRNRLLRAGIRVATIEA